MKTMQNVGRADFKTVWTETFLATCIINNNVCISQSFHVCHQLNKIHLLTAAV